MARVLQSVVFVCGRTLVLPPGWCCFTHGAPAKVARPTSCCRCPKCHRGKAPAPTTPTAPNEGTCPCIGRVATPPPAPKPVQASAVPIVGELLAVLGQPIVESIETIVVQNSTAHPPLNLLNCRWRC